MEGLSFGNLRYPRAPQVGLFGAIAFLPRVRTPSKIHLEREVNRRGTGHCTRRKPQSFKKVIKTGERFWISAEVESRQKYHSPRILMSTTLKLFGSGKGD